MSRFPRCLRVAVLSTALLAANVALDAQTTPPQSPDQAEAPPPAQVAPEAQPEETVTEKWLTFSNKALTARWGWMLIVDGLNMTQDSVNEEQVGRVPAKVEPRADRLFLVGTLKFKKPWRYNLGANFNGLDAPAGEKFSFLDIALDIPLTSWLGSVNIGRQKVGVSQEWMMPGTDWIFMERSGMANAFIPQRNIGLRLHQSYANGRVTYSAGAFNDWFVNQRALSDSGMAYAARVSFLPVDRNEGRNIVSVATAFYHKGHTERTLRFRSRPESNQADYFVETPSFAANHSNSTQFEVMAIHGPTQVFGEWTLTPISAPTVGDPFFYGGFVGASHFLTGEHRTFNRNDGTYGRFVPGSPLSRRNRGFGAWEVAGRYSFIDLTDKAIEGGTMKRLTGAISWYPNQYWRIEFNYGHGILARGGTEGHFNAFQGRIQVGF